MTGGSRGANQKAYGGESCGGTWIAAEALEQFMDAAVLSALSGPGFARALARRLEAAAAVDPTPEQLAADKAELAELARLKGELNPATGRPWFTIPEWLAAKAPIEARIHQAEARLAAKPDLAALVDLPKSKEQLRKAWARWPTERKRSVLKGVLDHVLILPAGRGGIHPVKDRVKPRWLVQPDRRTEPKRSDAVRPDLTTRTKVLGEQTFDQNF